MRRKMGEKRAEAVMEVIGAKLASVGYQVYVILPLPRPLKRTWLTSSVTQTSLKRNHRPPIWLIDW